MDRVGETSVAGFCKRLQELSAAVAEERSGLDATGRLSDELYHKLADIGVFRLWLPAALGGVELSPLDYMDVVEEAAALEGAIGWLVSNGGGMARTAAYLPIDSAREIFADPAAFVVSGTAGVGRAAQVDGGYRVTGRWPFGSGSPHATWFSPFCAVEGSDERILVYAPRADVVMHNNWHVSGLCGTGSGDFEFQDVFVPNRFAHPYQPEPTLPGSFYLAPTRSVYTWTVATVPLGLARGALTEFVRLATQRKRRGDTIPLADRELVQSEIGRIEARMCAARLFLRQAMTDLLAAIGADSDLVSERTHLRLAATFASETALSTIGQLTEIAGAVSIMQSCPLERYERDARAAAKHLAMSPAAYITGGQLVLGQDMSSARV